MTTIRSVPAYALTRPSGRTQMRNVFGYALAYPNPTPAPERPFGDTDYRKTEDDLLLDLIERANPGVFDEISPSDIKFGPPTAYTDPLDPTLNTKIEVFPAPGTKKVVGKQTLKYRRIDPSKLYSGRTTLLTYYQIANSLPVGEVRRLILEQFGLNFAASSLNPLYSLAAQPPTNVGWQAWTVDASSKCYVGSLRLAWVKGKRQISEMFLTPNIDGRQWPAGLIDFGDNRKPQGEYICYDTDFSEQGWNLNTWPVGAPTAKGSASLSFTAALKALAPHIDWLDDDHSKPGGWLGLTVARYSIPSAAVPDANAGIYNRVLTLTPPAGIETWFYGKLMFHYKV